MKKLKLGVNGIKNFEGYIFPGYIVRFSSQCPATAYPALGGGSGISAARMLKHDLKAFFILFFSALLPNFQCIFLTASKIIQSTSLFQSTNLFVLLSDCVHVTFGVVSRISGDLRIFFITFFSALMSHFPNSFFLLPPKMCNLHHYLN